MAEVLLPQELLGAVAVAVAAAGATAGATGAAAGRCEVSVLFANGVADQ